MNTKTETTSSECVHALESLPPVDLRSVQYVCMKCETFIEAGIDPSSGIVGLRFQDMHKSIAESMGATYEGETTYESVRRRKRT